MKTETILGIGALIVILVFVVFAFPRGMQVKPDPENKPPNNYAP
jgi:hypothetical protein